MEFKSAADLLCFAISKEQASKQFYLDLASQVKDIDHAEHFSGHCQAGGKTRRSH